MKTQSTSKNRPLIVGIGGSTRPGSTSERAMRDALAIVEEAGCDTAAFAGPDLMLPHFEMGIADAHPVAIRMIAALRKASGIIIASPGYHGSISGIVKNALDYTEEMRNDARPYFEGRVAGCIVCANGAQAVGTTLIAMRSIVHALRGWPTPYGVAIQTDIKPSGAGQSADWMPGLRIMAEQVAAFALSDVAAKLRAQQNDDVIISRAS